jgi:hypothetical protein
MNRTSTIMLIILTIIAVLVIGQLAYRGGLFVGAN